MYSIKLFFSLLLVTFAISAPMQVAAKVLFSTDFEVADLYNYSWTASGNSPVLSTGEIPACSGSKVMKAYVHRSNSVVSPVNYRTELTRNLDAWPDVSATLPLFQTQIISFSLFVPPSNVIDPGVDRGDIVIQFHGGGDDSLDGSKEGPGYRNPQLVLKVDQDKFYVEFIGDDAEFNTTELNKRYDQHKHLYLSDVTKGKWTNIQLQFNVDYRVNGGGFLKIWIDNALKVDYRGQFGFADSHGPYVKFGIYKPVWKSSRINDTDVSERTFYFDDFVVGDASETQSSTYNNCAGSAQTASSEAKKIVPRQYNGLPVVLLKIDDLKFYNQNDSVDQAWTRFLTFLREKTIKANIGAIGENFVNDTEAYRWFYSDAKAKFVNNSNVEIFNHSNCYCPAIFSDGTYEEQFDTLNIAQKAIVSKLGVIPIAFGSGGNQLNQYTGNVMNKHPDMRVWFFGNDSVDNTKILNLARTAGLTNIDAIESTSAFIENFERYLSYTHVVLQGHAGKWGTGQFNAFADAIKLLISKYPGVKFMTASEYYQYSGGSLIGGNNTTAPASPPASPIGFEVY